MRSVPPAREEMLISPSSLAAPLAGPVIRFGELSDEGFMAPVASLFGILDLAVEHNLGEIAAVVAAFVHVVDADNLRKVSKQ